jgi:hypothetical protein
MWRQRLGRMHQLRLGLDLQGFGRVLLAVSVEDVQAGGLICDMRRLEVKRLMLEATRTLLSRRLNSGSCAKFIAAYWQQLTRPRPRGLQPLL